MNFKGARVASDQAIKYETIADYMATDLITFTPDQEIAQAIDIMLTKRISGGPVLNEKRELVGMLSEKDCLKVLVQSSYHNMPSGKGLVKDYMSENVKTLEMDTDVVACANEFLNTYFRRFPVTQNGILKGQISRRDIMRAAQKIKATTW
ncbi:CBS domain-containing protein [Reichenbachiella carrageenanivorans]|uniref:CBS domain-containing protein n=1 Tax=Reichenbachiella carrageenanivorans TaxID=2979869 RepID=A0ABY6D1F6_9BACT|nr:CBS domain-containing protein [Reichenbachiella carrageenanivorans]UXX78898.1 CBS domain-containing protein [Reichenbachiella carrageenanivorans]